MLLKKFTSELWKERNGSQVGQKIAPPDPNVPLVMPSWSAFF